MITKMINKCQNMSSMAHWSDSEDEDSDSTTIPESTLEDPDYSDDDQELVYSEDTDDEEDTDDDDNDEDVNSKHKEGIVLILKPIDDKSQQEVDTSDAKAMNVNNDSDSGLVSNPIHQSESQRVRRIELYRQFIECWPLKPMDNKNNESLNQLTFPTDNKEPTRLALRHRNRGRNLRPYISRPDS
ncbi:uncharacterized protein LOC128963773 [Oppia nitens]|uniref:uncharacterized protein LOC128963773 n=1 Tax=Oppia nitens TaxID=1686743 RepID=UPI0023D9D835|nr:uncharacterized protein LOC128963773 [Oppia nitens]